jgi:hypothetical protein
MRKKLLVFIFLFLVLGFLNQSFAQFTEQELAERDIWEEFLSTAEIIKSDQPWSKREAVTRPWELTLEKEGIVKKALWKDAEGRMNGHLENWKWEIAAYRLDKYLGLNMVPCTVEKRFNGKRGSCQIYAGVMDMKEKLEKKIETPSYKKFHLNRALYLQRAFDNLIANDDRHQANYRLTDDFRLILIDHSRSFQTSKKFTKRLIYDEKNKENATFIMREIPRAFVEKLKTLDYSAIKEVVGDYLTDREIECVLVRRDLIIEWLETRIEKFGENEVLY